MGNINIKQYNGSGWESQKPITVGQNIYGSGTKATTALLDSNNKLARDFLQLYEHNIKLYRASYGVIMFRIINNDSSQYNTYAKIATALYNADYRLANATADLAMASGVYSESSDATRIPTGVFSTNGSTISYYYIDIVYKSGSDATIYTNNMSGYRMSTTTVANHANLYTWDYVRTL